MLPEASSNMTTSSLPAVALKSTRLLCVAVGTPDVAVESPGHPTVYARVLTPEVAGALNWSTISPQLLGLIAGGTETIAKFEAPSGPATSVIVSGPVPLLCADKVTVTDWPVKTEGAVRAVLTFKLCGISIHGWLVPASVSAAAQVKSRALAKLLFW